MIFSNNYLFELRDDHVFMRKVYSQREFRVTHTKTKSFSVAVVDNQNVVVTDNELLVCSGTLCFIQRHDLDNPRIIQTGSNTAAVVSDNLLFRISINDNFVSLRQAIDIGDPKINDVFEFDNGRVLVATNNAFYVMMVADYNTIIEKRFKREPADIIIPQSHHDYIVISGSNVLKYSIRTGTLVCEYVGLLPEQPICRLGEYIKSEHYLTRVDGDEIVSTVVDDAIFVEQQEDVLVAYDRRFNGVVLK